MIEHLHNRLRRLTDRALVLLQTPWNIVPSIALHEYRGDLRLWRYAESKWEAWMLLVPQHRPTALVRHAMWDRGRDIVQLFSGKQTAMTAAFDPSVSVEDHQCQAKDAEARVRDGLLHLAEGDRIRPGGRGDITGVDFSFGYQEFGVEHIPSLEQRRWYLAHLPRAWQPINSWAWEFRRWAATLPRRLSTDDPPTTPGH
jgi:hypothetical protein